MQTYIPQSYRPDIDGLRAIAVFAVISFHFSLGMPGGYVGVDVFFVISGFLITTLLAKNLGQNNFDIKNFWEKRIRRIFPALFFTTTLTTIAGLCILLPHHTTELGWGNIMQTIFSANFYYWGQSDYFAGFVENKPLLHTWSLAVEEQFYILFPAALWAMYKFQMTHKTIQWLIALLIFISLSCSCWGIIVAPSATFYLLPMRAWELLIGAFVAVSNCSCDNKMYRNTFTIIGLILILIPCFIYDHQTSFPGLAALPPCIGTALFIWAGKSGESYIGNLLSWKPMVFFGLISYSLYLTHWPLYVYLNYIPGIMDEPVIRFAAVLLCIIASIGMWKFIEQPFRSKKVFSSRRSMYVFAAICMVASLSFGSIIIINNGYRNRFSSKVNDILAYKYDKIDYQDQSLNDVKSKRFKRFGKTNSPKVDFFFWGDSHGRALF